MKKSILTLILISSVSHAETFTCYFTEPFVTSTYETSSETLTYQRFEAAPIVMKDVSFQIASAGVFNLISKDGKTLQSLTLNQNGSDGMSDKFYPFDVKDSSMLTGANGGFGGCESSQLKSQESQP